MFYPKFVFSSVCISTMMAACLVSALAQSVPLSSVSSTPEKSPVKTVYFRNIGLNNAQTFDRPIALRVAASIRGRVFNDENLTENTRSVDPTGISGVRVIVRSVDSENIVAHQLSDSNGRYDFPNLAPGRYTLELDPLSLPARFRVSDLSIPVIIVERLENYDLDIPIAAKRTITGIVFVDMDGDAEYKAGIDEPVEGAFISVDGNLARSNASGRYFLHDLRAGRTGLLVQWPKRNENTHVVFTLDSGPVTNRTVNVPRNP